MSELHLAAAARRGFLCKASLLGGACLLPTLSHAQSGNIHDLRGTVLVNGTRIDRTATIRPGDAVEVP